MKTSSQIVILSGEKIFHAVIIRLFLSLSLCLWRTAHHLHFLWYREHVSWCVVAAVLVITDSITVQTRRTVSRGWRVRVRCISNCHGEKTVGWKHSGSRVNDRTPRGERADAVNSTTKCNWFYIQQTLEAIVRALDSKLLYFLVISYLKLPPILGVWTGENGRWVHHKRWRERGTHLRLTWVYQCGIMWYMQYLNVEMQPVFLALSSALPFLCMLSPFFSSYIFPSLSLSRSLSLSL